MTNVIRIERDVEENLNDVGLAKEGETWLVYKVLFHLFVADEMLRKMSKYQFGNAKFWYGRVFRALFVRKLFRETKKTKKSSLPPAPPTIVKETIKEITETREIYKKGAPLLSLDERKKAFRDECHKHDERFGFSMVEDFFNHWSEATADEVMRFEMQKTWSTAKRLYKWSKDPITTASKLAAIRLERAKVHNRDGSAVYSNTPQQEAVARQRAADNARREEELDRARAESVSFDEYRRRLDAQASETS